MKRSLFIIVAVVISAICLPDKVNAQMKFGVQAGLNIPNMLEKDNNGKFDTKSLTGYNVGVLFDFLNNDNFNIVTGLKISSKGMKYISVNGQLETEYKYKTTNLDLPICVKAGYEIDDNFKLFGLGGGYLGYGLSGTYYEDGEGFDIGWEDECETGLKRLDYGIVIGAGVRYKSIQLTVDYQIGLKNLSQMVETPDVSMKNRVLGISLAYYFGKKK